MEESYFSSLMGDGGEGGWGDSWKLLPIPPVTAPACESALRAVSWNLSPEFESIIVEIKPRVGASGW